MSTSEIQTPFAFDPVEYTTAKHRFISFPPAELTGNKQTVIRWATMPDVTAFEHLSDAPAALTAIRQHAVHLQILQEAGIEIPPHQTFIGSDPRSKGRIAIYQAVEHITVRKLDLESPVETLRRYGNALLTYTDWILETDQPNFLCDIGITEQYTVGEHDQPILLDIEPAYMDIHEYGDPNIHPIFDRMRSDAELYSSL